MKSSIQRILALAAVLTIAAAPLGTVPAAAEGDNELPLIPVVSEDENVELDELTGVLTLRGKFTKEEVRAYAADSAVETVIAESSAVFPADCSELFRDFKALTFDLSKGDTSAVTDMSWMFRNCTDAVSVILSDYRSFIDTSSVVTMKGMFSKCSSLTGISFYGINTSAVENFNGMFHYCSGLRSLDLSSLNTSKAVNLSGMFSGCTELSALDLSSFDISGVKYLHQTFMGCTGLRTLDLSSFDNSAVTDYREMFSGCTGLETVLVSRRWTPPTSGSSDGMFRNCSAIAGGKGTAYDPSFTDSSRACIDSIDAPGYFSEEYRLSLGGTAVTDINCGDVLGDGSAAYDPESRTLTLRSDLNDCFIDSSIDGLTVIAEGDVNISCGSTALIFRAPTVITGSGRLTVSSGSTGISAEADLTVNKAEIIVDSGLGIQGSENAQLRIADSELTVSAPYAAAAVSGFGSVSLEDCSIASPASAYFNEGIPVERIPDPDDPESFIEDPVNELTILPFGTPIDSAGITAALPEALAAPDFTAVTDADADCALRWFAGERELTGEDVFPSGSEITALIRLTPAEGFRLTRNTAVTLCGKTAERTAVFEDGSAEYSVSFTTGYKHLRGDVNGDGEVGMKDITDLQRYINGWDVKICEENADFNEDGEIDMKDLADIQRAVNSQSPDVSAQEPLY